MSDCLAELHGCVTALVTPFRDGVLDLDAMRRLAARQTEHDVRALVICGSTGEASSLAPGEYAAAISATVSAVGDAVPVIAGCTAPATEAAVALAVAARDAGANALLCAPPPYVKPTQAGLCAHIRALSRASGLPIMLYDVPGRTCVAIPDSTVAILFERRLISVLKDATADLARPTRLRALCGEELAQFSGDDLTAPAHRAMGGVGCVSVTANVVPGLCAELHASWDEGDLVRFARLRDALGPLHAALFAETNPIPVKAALSHLGLCSDAVRLPLTVAGNETRVRLARLLARLGCVPEGEVSLQIAMAS